MTGHAVTVAPSHAGTVRHHEEAVMGTVVTFDITVAEELPAPDAVAIGLARARAVLQRADATFSTWKPDSPVSRLRRGEIALEEAPAVVRAVLDRCAAARVASGGWFDPWAMPGGVDPSGYVKGWAAQRALDELVVPGLLSALVNAAGDIATARPAAPGSPFRIGIVDPSDPHRLACVALVTGAVATSGTYERGPHLIDPHSVRPSARAASASVTGPDLGLADALATAVGVGGDEALELIEPMADYEAMIIDHRGAMRSTSRFPFAD